MALNPGQADADISAHSSTPDVNGLSLQILSPSFRTSARISFNHVRPTTTVSELKTMITTALATRPPPESQRLIYRGRELSNTQETLTKILELGNGETHSIHLVLPPGTPLLETSDTKPSFKSDEAQSRSVQASLPQSRAFRSQRIEDLLNPALTPPELDPESNREATSQGIFGCNASFRASSSSKLNDSQTQSSGTGQESDNRGNATFSTTNAVDLPRVGPNISPIQRLKREASSDSDVIEPGPSHTGLQGLHENYGMGNSTASSINLGQHRTHRGPELRTTSNPVPRFISSAPTSGGYQAGTSRLPLLSQRILAMEDQIDHGISPSVDEISRIRFQLYQIQDEEYRNPLKPRDASLEGWLGRIISVATRADQLRIMKARDWQPSNYHTGLESATAGPTPTAAYLLKAPNGDQYVVMRPNNQPAASTLRYRTSRLAPNIPGLVVGGNMAQLGAPGPTGRFPANRVFRPPLVRRRYRQYVRPINLVAIVRSLWLFIRLYFFSYLISARGSWLRTFLVMGSAIIAIFSETSLPQRIQRVVLGPVQRHLENLLPVDGQQAREVNGTQRPEGVDANFNLRNESANVGQGRSAAAQGEQGGVWEGLRSLERSIAIFIASFVPGLSERHIAARNAAEAARRNEEEQRQQADNQRPEEAPDGTDGVNIENNTDISDVRSSNEANISETPQHQQPDQELRG
ncbi:uncharacterized protein CIMG_03111 [Coccidioides immitis RS]|uniref:Ubiquitin-like domain-containing protein n=2 Tax=Coccidioides immitis TaxID=5501 RepID=J3KAM7_COCIM|nr:uncharacterized protein CIMG_03111 [Coccidioides immitis RS]EAS32087.3 hypothetical protein CIMG_03111 [Coccidioides immitis RS]KMU82357.1 hypothetical protein CIHG_00141 [Coccidioides immitis H538.4]TPX19267.1 hypothetical protein DIZ76_017055 [Coccidioides immitis]